MKESEKKAPKKTFCKATGREESIAGTLEKQTADSLTNAPNFENFLTIPSQIASEEK